MTIMSKNVLSDKLDDLAVKCNNIYHRTIKIDPVDFKSSTYIDFDHENIYIKIQVLKFVINRENPENITHQLFQKKFLSLATVLSVKYLRC